MVAEVGIMTDDAATVTREPNVKLYSVAAVRQRVFEGGQGVFSRKLPPEAARTESPHRTDAAMAKQQRT